MNMRELRLATKRLEKAEGRYGAAAIIGISPVTLRAFVSGAKCRPGTVKQIEAAVVAASTKK